MSPLRQAALFDSLTRTVEKLRWKPGSTAWADYAGNTSYASEAATSKDEIVERFLRHAGGQVVWDLGANTGRFSEIAVKLGKDVVALDGDAGATDLHYHAVRARKEQRVLPLLVDLANPSPAIGWMGTERRSILARTNADTVLALALVHHLAIGRNVPLPMLTDLFATLAPNLIVEFVPKGDPMVDLLLRSRKDIFPDYTLDGFKAALATRFDLADETQVAGSGRTLLRLTRR
jgi:ribosomal protein L11 methylase PrmA